MIRLRRPSRREVEELLASPALRPNYPEVGATAEIDAPGVREELARRYDVDRHAFPMGRGRALFERAAASLLAWRHFEIPWLELHAPGAVAPGQVVATATSVAGLWFVNPCRVVYVELPPDRSSVAFAYGTLRGHAESGEERFRVAFDPTSEVVRYDVTAFSRPALLATKLGYRLARRLQERFARASGEALARAASHGAESVGTDSPRATSDPASKPARDAGPVRSR